MQTVALVIVSAAGLWLVAIAFLMALWPHYCPQVFEKMASSLASSN